MLEALIMKKFIILNLLLILTFPNTNGQGLFQLSYQSIFGDTLVGESYSVQTIGQSGYVVGGYTLELGTADFQLSKIDSFGNFLWSRAIGGSSGDFCHSVNVASDGGFIMTGWGQSFGAGNDDVYLLKTDANGNLQWAKTFGGSGIDRGRAVIQTNDGGFAIAGHTNSNGFGLNDMLVIKTDMNGDTLWTKSYGFPGNDNAWSIAQTLDNGYIITGNTSIGPGFLNAILLKLDQAGDTIWTRTYGAGSGLTSGLSVVEVPTGGYALSGWTSAFGAGNRDAFILRTDSEGNPVWAKAYGGTDDDDSYGLTIRNTSGNFWFGISGSTKSFGPGTPNRNIILIQTDSAGNTDGRVFVYGDSLDDVGYGVSLGIPFGITGIGNGYFVDGKKGNSMILDDGAVRICPVVNPTIQETSFSFDVDTMVIGIVSGGNSISSPTMFDSLIFQSDSVLCFYANFWGIEDKPILDAAVFPNPSQGIFWLTYDPELGQAKSIEVMDLYGRIYPIHKPYSQESSEQIRIDISTLSRGQYVLRIEFENHILRSRVIIQE